MTPGDRMMHLGDASPNRRSTMVNLELLDGVPDWDRFVRTFDRLSRVIPRFRQRVVVPTLPTTLPRWVTDPDFDLSYHVRRVNLAGEGTLRDLLDLAETIGSSPLDPARPLWTVTLVEGMAEGRSAVLDHLSHVVADGVGGVAMAAELYDTEADAPEREMVPIPTPHELTPNQLAKQGLVRLPVTGLGLARGVLGKTVRAARHPKQTAEFLSSLGRVLQAGDTPGSPLLRRRGIQRRTVTLQVDLAALKAAGKKHEGSVNDAYLAALTLGMKHYHEAKGVPLDRMPLAVPVNLRKEGDSMEGNAFTGVSVAAPVAEPDLGTRIRDIRDQVRRGKGEAAVDLMGLLAPAVIMLPPIVWGELDGSLKVADVQASNVPSYPVATWIAGVPVIGQYGLGPLPGVAMMATMVSRNGTCYIAFRYDTLAFDDGDLLAASLAQGFHEVVGQRSKVSDPDGTLPRLRSTSAASRKLKDGGK